MIKYILLPALLVFNLYALSPTSVGVLTKIIQTVEYKAVETENWGNAKLGSVVYDGDEVRTGSRSLALLKFLDNSLIRVRENSVVTVYGSKEDNKLNKNTFIERGRVGFEITDQGDDEFKFTTPTGVASIRGTKGFFEVPLDGSMLIFVKEGVVEIESLLGTKASGSVGAGKFAKIDTSGDLVIEEAGDAYENQYQAMEKETVKKIRIKLNNGEEFLLEYLD